MKRYKIAVKHFFGGYLQRNKGAVVFNCLLTVRSKIYMTR